MEQEYWSPDPSSFCHITIGTAQFIGVTNLSTVTWEHWKFRIWGFDLIDAFEASSIVRMENISFIVELKWLLPWPRWLSPPERLWWSVHGASSSHSWSYYAPCNLCIVWLFTCHVSVSTGVLLTPLGRGCVLLPTNIIGNLSLFFDGAWSKRVGGAVWWPGRRLKPRWSPSWIAAVPSAAFPGPVRRMI